MEDLLKERLAMIIKKNLKAEFENVHFSKNLMNTIKVSKNSDGNWEVDIPADLYNLKQFKKKGLIIKTYKGSYAERINQTGGFAGKHKGYIETIIAKSVKEWLASMGKHGKVSEE